MRDATSPFARTCSGKISGPYTHGIQLTEAPKMSMNKKKKATEAEAVGFSTDVPRKRSLVFSKVFVGSGIERSGWLCLCALEREGNGNHHHGYEEAERSPHPGLTMAVFVREKGWVEGAWLMLATIHSV